MKLVFKKNDAYSSNCFTARRDTIPCIEQDWHFHPELEIIYFLKSRGTRYVGNSIGNFEPGEMYLIGSNVPHLFRNHREYYQETDQDDVDLVVVKFMKDFLGTRFNELIENRSLNELFNESKKGLKFGPSVTAKLHDTLIETVEKEGLGRIVNLLTILEELLEQSHEAEILSTDQMSHSFNADEKEKMRKIIYFLNQNFERKIELEEVASIACMTTNSFCRYFKKRTKKSLIQFLSEIRIGHACKLLIEGELPISTIAYQSGFNTLTNFNRQFKAVIGTTPSTYLEKYQSQAASA